MNLPTATGCPKLKTPGYQPVPIVGPFLLCQALSFWKKMNLFSPCPQDSHIKRKEGKNFKEQMGGAYEVTKKWMESPHTLLRASGSCHLPGQRYLCLLFPVPCTRQSKTYFFLKHLFYWRISHMLISMKSTTPPIAPNPNYFPASYTLLLESTYMCVDIVL